MSPVRVQRKRTTGWRMPENTVYVGRGSKWGNPYKIAPGKINGFYIDGEAYPGEPQHWWAPTKQEALGIAVNQYLVACAWGAEKRAAIRAQLAGKNLACWCPLGQPCHADVLLEVANRHG